MGEPKVKLSQCMIVKNEEANIEAALSWGKDIVCEQIVVDTGSTDRTVEIAARMGAKIFHFEWIGDFSAAKNYAIQQASGEWIAFLDADEIFPQEDVRKLMDILELINSNKKIFLIRTKLVNLYDEKGTIMGASYQDRVFRNEPEIRYKNRIHELVAYEGKEHRILYDAQEELMILHTGYGKHVDKKGKGDRNIPLLEEEHEKNPQDPMLLMYLGDSYGLHDRREEAIECYRKVLWDEEMEQTQDVAFIRAGLQLMRSLQADPVEEIRDEFFRIAHLFKERGWERHPDIDFFIGELYTRENQLEQAVTFYEAALEKLEHYTGDEVCSMFCFLERVYTIIAAVAVEKEDYRKAVQYAVNALRANRYSANAINILLATFMTEWRDGSSIEPYWQMLCGIYDIGNLKDLIFLHKISEALNFKALSDKVWETIPTDVRRMLQDRKNAEG